MFILRFKNDDDIERKIFISTFNSMKHWKKRFEEWGYIRRRYQDPIQEKQFATSGCLPSFMEDDTLNALPQRDWA